MANELLPCPFCGEPAQMVVSPANTSGPEQAQIRCTGCKVTTDRVWADNGLPKAADEATRAWNRRAPVDAQAKPEQPEIEAPPSEEEIRAAWDGMAVARRRELTRG